MDHPKGALTLDQEFCTRSYEELFPNRSKEELCKLIGYEIEIFIALRCISRAEYARSLGVSDGAVKGWINGDKLPCPLWQKAIRRTCHSFSMQTVKNLLLLPPTASKTFNNGAYSVISAFDEMHYEYAIERAEAIDEEAYERYSDLNDLDDYMSRNCFMHAMAIRYQAAEDGKAIDTEFKNILEKALAYKPKARGVLYAIQLELLQFDFIDACSKQDARIKKTDLNQIWSQLEALYKSLPAYSHALWNMSRVASALEDEQKCDYAWKMLLKHSLSMSHKAIATRRRKIIRIFNTENMDYFIRANNLRI